MEVEWPWTKDPPSIDTRQTQPGVRRTYVVIPYVSGLSERLKKTYKKHGISTIYKPANTLRSSLVKVKDKPEYNKTSHVVYGIKCETPGCDATYVGETQQSLAKRMSQHRRPSPGDMYDSAVYTHLKNTGHSFQDKNVKVLDREHRWYERGVKEAIWERVEKPTLNKRGGLRHKLSRAWDRGTKLLSCHLVSDSVDSQ